MSSKTERSRLARISNHAKLRWQQRGGTPKLSLRQAWSDGYYVGLPTHVGKAKLHPPTKTLILKRDGTFVTVFNSESATYKCDHLISCEGCSLQFQPSKGDRTCPWCGRSNKKPTHE